MDMNLLRILIEKNFEYILYFKFYELCSSLIEFISFLSSRLAVSVENYDWINQPEVETFVSIYLERLIWISIMGTFDLK